MANNRNDELKNLWVQWTRDAIARYVPPEDIDDAEELVDDMIEMSSQYAFGMLDEYEAAFGESGAGSRRRRSEGRSRRRKDPPSGEGEE